MICKIDKDICGGEEYCEICKNKKCEFNDDYCYNEEHCEIVNKLKKKNWELKKETDFENMRKTSTINKLEKEIGALKKGKDLSEYNYELLREQYNKLKNKNSELQKSYDFLYMRQDGLNELNNYLIKQYFDLLAVVHKDYGFCKKCEKIKIRNKRIKYNYESLREQYNNLKNKNDSLERENEALKKDKDLSEYNYESLREQYNKLKENHFCDTCTHCEQINRYVTCAGCYCICDYHSCPIIKRNNCPNWKQRKTTWP